VNSYFDTTILVASCVETHVHHDRAMEAMQSLLTRDTLGYVSGHGLAECYSVLTRTPFSPPVLPTEAWQLLTRNILPNLAIVSLSAEEYQEVIQRCSENGWGGGRVYDALHIRSAQKANCERIFTFNVRHFEQLAPELRGRIMWP
jgi:predicted nucleic acid-binding protein